MTSRWFVGFWPINLFFGWVRALGGYLFHTQKSRSDPTPKLTKMIIDWIWLDIIGWFWILLVYSIEYWILTGWWFGICSIFPFSWECHHPNWRSPSFFRGVAENHHPVIDMPWSPRIFHGYGIWVLSIILKLYTMIDINIKYYCIVYIQL